MIMKTEQGDEVLKAIFTGSEFEIRDSENTIQSIYKPFLEFAGINENPSDFECYILYNFRDDNGENDIFQVKIPNGSDSARIGWIFPIQSLESSQHAFVQNKHYLQYAYVAVCHLLNDENVKVKGGIMNDEFLLKDAFLMNETILIIDKRNTSQIPDYNLDDYIVSLFSHGYSFSGEGNSFDSCERVLDKHLQLKPVSSLISNRSLISSLFRELIPTAKEAISQFHLCYQIIEILISSVFECELKFLLHKLGELHIGSDILKQKEKLDKIINEKNRVKWLFCHYTSYALELGIELKRVCDLLLEKQGESIPDSIGASLYSVRCLLVHRCYLLSMEDKEMLEAVNDAFFGVAIQMLFSFRDGAQTRELVEE